MTIYMAERDLKGISMDDLAAAQKAAIDTSNEFTQQGKSVRYIRTTFLPEEGNCRCLFEASSPEDVRAINETAGLPFNRIIEALDLTP